MHPLRRLLFATASILAISAIPAAAGQLAIKLTPLGSYREFATGHDNVCLVGTSQIAAYDPVSSRLFVTDALADSDHNSLDILDIHSPSNPTLFKRLKVSDLTGSPNFEPPG